MKNFSEISRQWAPTIIVVIIALFAVVRMQTVQAELVKQIERKVNKEAYDIEQAYQRRERDRLAAIVSRLDESVRTLENAVTVQNAIVSGRNK